LSLTIFWYKGRGFGAVFVGKKMVWASSRSEASMAALQNTKELVA
jgi:hypothetical protein